MLCILLLSTSFIQKTILDKFTSDFQSKTQQKLLINKISLQWNGKFQFSEFYLEDHHGDTLLYIHELRTSIKDFRKLQENDFNLSDIDAEGVYINLKKYNNEKSNSLQVVLEKLKNEVTKKTKTKFIVEHLSLLNGKFRFEDLNDLERAPIEIKDLVFSITNFSYSADSLNIKTEFLEGKMISPINEHLISKGIVSYAPGKLKLTEWELQNDNNKIKGELILNGKNRSFKNFNKKGNFEIAIEEGHLDLKNLFPTILFLKKTKPIKLTLNANGSLQKINLDFLQFTNNDIDFRGSGQIQNATNLSEIQWNLVIDSLKTKTNYFFNNEILDSIPKKFLSEIKNINLKGNISSSFESMSLDIHSKNKWGTFSAEGILGKGVFVKSFHNREFDIKSVISDLDLNLFLSKKSNIKANSNLEISGILSKNKSISVNWVVSELNLRSPKIEIKKITLEGTFKEQQFRNTLSANSKGIRFKSDLRFDFGNEIPKYTLAANIQELDLNLVGLNFGQGKRMFKAVVLSSFKGKNLDELEGKINVYSASIKNNNQTVTINPISIIQEIKGSDTQLLILNTDCVSGSLKGQFEISEIASLFQNALNNIYPFIPYKKTKKNQKLSFKLTIFKKFLDALYPDFSISDNIILNGTISSDVKDSQIVLDAPFIKWNELKLEKIHFQIDTKNPIYNSFLNVGYVSHKYYSGKDFNLISTKLNDTLYFRSEFISEKRNEFPFELNFYHSLQQNGISHFGLKKSKIPLGSDVWTLNPENTNHQKLSYSLSDKTFDLSDFLAVSGNQSIQLSGIHKNNKNFNFKINVKNIRLQEIFAFDPTFLVEGVSSLNARVIRSKDENRLSLNLAINDWKINQNQLGKFNLNVIGDTQNNSYNIVLGLIDGIQNKIKAQGFIKNLENPELNLNINFKNMNLAFLSPLGKKAIQNIRGEIDGKINLWGAIENLKHDGSLNLKKAGFEIPYLNIDYQMKDTKVLLNNQTFGFETVGIIDSSDGTNALFKGSFSHTNFSNWQVDFDFSSDRMLLLNRKKKPETLFYGKGFLDGTVNVKGPTKNLKIDLLGVTEEGTSIKVPWSENYGLSETTFVSFIDKNSINRFTKQDNAKALEEIRGLEMNFDLDVNNKAEIEIVIDQETGSYLSGRGAGNLLMDINTNGKFNMWGDFIAYEGIYNFKNLGVIEKRFNLKPGGTIVWEGNPLDALMDLEAVYDVPGGANPALLLDNPNFNKKIPTEVLIRLQGNLLKPDDPVFEIDFPNTSGTVASEINYRLADPERIQLQAISLLSQGIFINEVSVSMEGITNNLYQKASKIFSDLLGEENDKLNIGVDYLQGDKSALLDIATEDRLGFTLSTKISDRILLNGKIGVPVGGLEQTLIVGNVQIDFILNDEGTLRAKVFNKENEFRYIGDELGYTQGLGLSYNVDFDTFKELIEKISNSVIKSKGLKSKKDKTYQNNIIEFIKK
jgi:hypothetical protein